MCVCLCQQTHRGGERRAEGDRFHSDFPSLEEQDGMSKRELEDLRERRGREGYRERSPVLTHDRPWVEPYPHRPPPGNMHPYPPGPYPPHLYGPYMMPHSMRHGSECVCVYASIHPSSMSAYSPPLWSNASWERGTVPPTPSPDGVRSPSVSSVPTTKPL